MNLELARGKDSADPLKEYRGRFFHGDENLIYLNGNSLGRLPMASLERMNQLVAYEWGERLIRGWKEGWYTASKRAGDLIAELIGAKPHEVIVSDSTSVNLFKLALSALLYQKCRSDIVSDSLNFPSDLYVFQSALEAVGRKGELLLARSQDEITVEADVIENTLSEKTALLSLSHVAYKSGFMYDLPQITKIAHRNGAMMLWDLSHAVGAVPISLNEANVEMAVGCTYKYLNGGPGAPAFLYVREDLIEKLVNPIAGWFGHENSFAFEEDYRPSGGIERFLVGTPPVLSLEAMHASLEVSREAGIAAIRRKSLAQTDYLLELWRTRLRPLGVSLNSPEEPASRGAHLAFSHPEGYRITQALIHEKNTILDFRAPDTIRFGIAPLYNSHEDIFVAVCHLEEVLTEKRYERYEVQGLGVT
ncbi:MAG: kynureninase [Bdellovibrionales bacterium]|nr:kynureninase [Bdellovibrionales bacterium]